jgi:hypothetical protein
MIGDDPQDRSLEGCWSTFSYWTVPAEGGTIPRPMRNRHSSILTPDSEHPRLPDRNSWRPWYSSSRHSGKPVWKLLVLRGIGEVPAVGIAINQDSRE